MKRKTFIFLIIVLLLLCLIEIYIERKAVLSQIKSNFKLKSIYIVYAFDKNLKEKKKTNQSLTKIFFLLYPRLYFIVLRRNGETIFTASKTPHHNTFLNSFISTLRNDKLIRNIYKTRDKTFYFISSKLQEYNIITSFHYDYSFLLRYIRNSVILLLLYAVLFYQYFKKQKPVASFHAQKIKIDSLEQETRETIDSATDTYRTLYKDNQKLTEEIENLSTFREVGLAINSILDFSQMLHVIMGVVMHKMNVQKIEIYFIDENRKELIARIGRESNKILSQNDLKDNKIILGEGSIGKAMEYLTPVIQSDSLSLNCKKRIDWCYKNSQ